MKNSTKIAVGGMLTSLVLLSAVTAFAATTATDASVQAGTTAAPAKTSTKTLSSIIAKGDKAVTNRINSLNKISAKVTKMKYLTADQKTTMTATITTDITDMNTAKAKLDADTDLATAKQDYASIFKDNRIGMVVVPQIAFVSSADNLLGSITAIQNSLTSIQARITKAQTAGKDVTALQASYTDAQAKIADGNTQATAIVTTAATLSVDHGDATIIAANKAADASIKTSKGTLTSDIKAVKADITSMKKALKALHF